MKITDFNYFGSTLGNAYYSGLTFQELWSCMLLASTREQFDEAVLATIKLKALIKNHGHSSN